MMIVDFEEGAPEIVDVEEGSPEIVDELISFDDECDDVYIDLDSFWEAMATPACPSQDYILEEKSSIDDPQGVQNSKDLLSPKAEIPGSVVLSPSHKSEVSYSRSGSSDGFSESAGTSSVNVGAGMLEPSPHFGIVEQSFRTVTDDVSVQQNGLYSSCVVSGPHPPPSYCQNNGSRGPSELPEHSDPLCSHGTSHVTHVGETSVFRHMNHDKDLFGCSRLDFHSENMEDAVIDVDRTSQDDSHTESSSCETNKGSIQDIFPENGGMYLFGSDDPPYGSSNAGFQSLACDGGGMINTMDEGENVNEDFISEMPHVDRDGFQFWHPKSESGSGSCVPLNGQGGFSYSSDMSTVQDKSKKLYPDSLSHIFSNTGDDMKVEKNVELINTMDEGENFNEDFISEMPHVDRDGFQFLHPKPESGSDSCVPLNGQGGFSYFSDTSTVQDRSKKLYLDSLSHVFSNTGDDMKVEKNVESITSNEIVSRASEVVDDIISRKCYGGVSKLPPIKGIQWSSSDPSCLISRSNIYVSSTKDEKEDILLKRDFLPPGMVGETNPKTLAIGSHDCNSAVFVSGQHDIMPLASVKPEMNFSKFNSFYRSNITYKGVQSNKIEHINLDDEPDVCILEDISTPAVALNPVLLNGKSFTASQFSTPTDSLGQMALGHSKLKPNNERAIFQVAMQDLSQPKSEAIPPDGMAVPLMKHQRIALFWMVNNETKGAYCSGGILADDQGLGKTVSTIALILKERSPSYKAPMEHCQTELCDLDKGYRTLESCYVKDPRELNGGKTYIQTKGKLPAGTLIVCPTSVLRQWSEELHNKVTKEADLSVLIYHGSNRTKDPLELAKYDVVITTYAIVSMEVPKQPVVGEDNDQISTPFKGCSSNKRKLPDTASCKKSSRSKMSNKGIDNKVLETDFGPLAKVGWFRVVLDEAQTIKNHRTQVARACWGLRAKRRWCLSGTPIQNAIDDLYSYFRFLKHDLYATFGTFCERIKSPIQKNPNVGYKKLQAVLKTIMLRRTKGTCIDGEPIINLPPKTIELKRVDFSMEERDFYRRLEADSQAQFAEYAKAGTVKQNYVNILLLLLRLRQACDHPLLVRGVSSTSQMTSSIEMAKKLSSEKNIFLLNCLEASLAICGICNDPPEDAVVTICGHVFCNQCICEHMIGDDTHCPNKNCKTRLTMSHVFSITTLRSAISDSLNPENKRTPYCSDSEFGRFSEPCSFSYPEGSSKIKAALEILKSLSKPHDPALRLSSLEPIEGCYGSDLLHDCDSVGKNESSEMKNDSQNPVKVLGEKAIVFSQWTRMLDLLEDYLKASSIQYRRLDGTMPIAARDRAVKEFNTMPQVSVMIMSLKAASLGLNMVAACHVILLDLWWNPTTEDQAIDRAHRIGQTRPVSVHRMTVKDTVEDRILALQEKKREMVASAFGEDEAGGRQTRLTEDDLKYLFLFD